MIFQPIGLPVQQNKIDPPGPDDMFWVKNKWQSPATAHQKSRSCHQDRGGGQFCPRQNSIFCGANFSQICIQNEWKMVWDPSEHIKG